MTDEQRTDSLGCYGSAWARTPCMDRLAREGAVFDAAMTPAPVCAAARAAMLTGQSPPETGVWCNDKGAASRQLPHLVPRFADAGYRTASFGKHHYAAANQAFELEREIPYPEPVHAFGYADRYDTGDYDVVQYPTQQRPWVLAGRFPEGAEQTTEWQAVDAALSWVDETPADRPFMLRLSFNLPHTPVSVPAPYDTLIDEDAVTLAPEAETMPDDAPAWMREALREFAGSHRLTAGEIRRMRACYYGAAAFVDAQFARLIDALRQRGLMEDTIIVFVSDHGAHLGDYGMVQKQTFYEPTVRVPFVFHAPGRVMAGSRVARPVSAGSLLPTVMQLAGLDVPTTTTQPSLARTLTHGDDPADLPVFSAIKLAPTSMPDDRLVMVRHDRWKLSVVCDPQVRDGSLHDLEADPHERVNRYDDPACAAVADELRRAVEGYLR